MPTEIVELRSKAELREASPVIRELHHLLDERK
jgi:hypothetical protein